MSMWTRGPLRRPYWSPRSHHGIPARSHHPAGRWYRGTLITGGHQPLHLPGHTAGGGPRQGDAMDPSNPRTWRKPVMWASHGHSFHRRPMPTPPHAFGHHPTPWGHR